MSDRSLSLADFRRRCEECSRERLGAAVREAVPERGSVEAKLAVGKPYREILRVAAEELTDLIVMGVHGRRVADLMSFGSTTQHVVGVERSGMLAGGGQNLTSNPIRAARCDPGLRSEARPRAIFQQPTCPGACIGGPPSGR
jgi:hypothetical protein